MSLRRHYLICNIILFLIQILDLKKQKNKKIKQYMKIGYPVNNRFLVIGSPVIGKNHSRSSSCSY